MSNKQDEELKEQIYESLEENKDIPTYMRAEIKKKDLSAGDLVEEINKAVKLTEEKNGN